ncbi:3362_t:CDS:2, partial [Scutellospora calospora]
PTEFRVSFNDDYNIVDNASSCELISKHNSCRRFNSKSYFHYLSQYKSTDLIIEVGEKHKLERFMAHTAILSKSTPYFKCSLSSTWARFENDKIIFKKPNIAPQVFNIILDGKVLWDDHTEQDLLDFLVAADELLLIDEILDEGQCYLIEQRYEWILSNLSSVTFYSFRYKPFKKLKKFCMERICENPKLIFFRSNYFLNFDDSFWINFLSQDHIQMDEFEIWHNLILWGIGQSSLTNLSFFNFSKKELADLKNILHQEPDSLYWINNDNDKYLHTDDSFIFSFSTCKNSKKAKFSRVKKSGPAIRDNPKLGPCFGKGDIYMTNNFNNYQACSSNPSSFDDLISPKNFSIIEYAVFQIVYKRSEENRWISFMNPKYFKDDKYVGPVV